MLLASNSLSLNVLFVYGAGAIIAALLGGKRTIPTT